MIQNNNISLTKLEQHAVEALHSAIAKCISEKSFTMSLQMTDGAFAEKYVELVLPLQPEYEERFTPPIDERHLDKLTIMILESMGIKVEPKALVYYSANNQQDEEQGYGLWM